MDCHRETADNKEGGAEDFKIKIDPDWDNNGNDNGEFAVGNPKREQEETVGFKMETEMGGVTLQYQQNLSQHTHGKMNCNSV